ncbi:hypothetical protein AQUCO_117500001v1 [Aquilegia coerulea]|uniref:Transmembrane protein n=1 Tax=Aquilegia coerulea TaxID=218851 RepID=A0A2G5C081_AQUCA|nr:hypothetical protein AQUCO_117500001v1 [Aquilegia coerulea]
MMFKQRSCSVLLLHILLLFLVLNFGSSQAQVLPDYEVAVAWKKKKGRRRSWQGLESWKKKCFGVWANFVLFV